MNDNHNRIKKHTLFFSFGHLHKIMHSSQGVLNTLFPYKCSHIVYKPFRGGGGEVFLGIRSGVVPPGSLNPVPIVIFRIRFQTWPLKSTPDLKLA